jgi:hypothetical protein
MYLVNPVKTEASKVEKVDLTIELPILIESITRPYQLQICPVDRRPCVLRDKRYEVAAGLDGDGKPDVLDVALLSK